MAKAPWMMTATALSLTLGLAACDSGEDTPPVPTATQTTSEAQAPQAAANQADSEQVSRAGDDGPDTADGNGAVGGESQAASDPGSEPGADETTSWENTEDDVNEALRETERRFEEAEKELEEQFKAAEEQDVQRNQELEIQPEAGQ